MVVFLLINKSVEIMTRYDGPLETTLLAEAIVSDNLVAARWLLEQGANPNALGRQRSMPLKIAAVRPREAFIHLLVEFGADVNRENDGGWTPLLMAASRDDPANVRALLKHGADPNQANDFGDTAIMFAAGRTSGIFWQLIEAGADPCAVSRSGRSAIHRGVRILNHAQHICDAGCDVTSVTTLRNQPNRSPLHRLIRLDELLPDIDQGALDPEDQEATRLRIAALLIEHGADLTSRDEDGRTPLQLARELDRSEELIRLLKDAGRRR